MTGNAGPYLFNGQPALEVRGFSTDWKLLQELDKHHWIEGKGSNIPNSESISFTNKFKNAACRPAVRHILSVTSISSSMGSKKAVGKICEVCRALPTPWVRDRCWVMGAMTSLFMN